MKLWKKQWWKKGCGGWQRMADAKRQLRRQEEEEEKEGSVRNCNSVSRWSCLAL